MAKRTLIIVVDSDLNTTHFLPQDKFLANELKGIAQLLRNNTAKLAMFSIDQINKSKETPKEICECTHSKEIHTIFNDDTAQCNNAFCMCNNFLPQT